MYYQVPSWISYLSIGETLVLISYVLAFALFESGIVLIFLVFLCLLLPVQFLKRNFIAQSSVLISMISLVAVVVQLNIKIIYRLNLTQLILYPLVILVVIILLLIACSILFKYFDKLTHFVNAVADRMVIFSVIYIPLGIISLIVVIIRNLFS
jgi:hypothetical protein